MTRTSEFDYELPPELIAQTPVEPRDASRLMVIDRTTGDIQHHHFYELPDLLRPGDVLVANDSRVIPARLFARKRTGGKVEILLLVRRDDQTWEALVRGHRIRPGTRLVLEKAPDVYADVVEVTSFGGRLLRFNRPIDGILPRVGIMPLPPYIHHPLQNPERYQTIFAREKGSAAAPTAGLHFTPRLMKRLQERGIEFRFVTLHVGLDTFRPITEEDVEAHRIHSEWAELDVETAIALNRAKAEGRRIIAVGTTSVRVLETATHPEAIRGEDAQVGWPEDTPLDVPRQPLIPFRGWTTLYITPGFEFRAVDAMITNFHLPRSTLLVLVAAFMGKELMERAYREAIEKRYRFYSFGDAMLIL